jgi:hypothetical protein
MIYSKLHRIKKTKREKKRTGEEEMQIHCFLLVLPIWALLFFGFVLFCGTGEIPSTRETRSRSRTQKNV